MQTAWTDCEDGEKKANTLMVLLLTLLTQRAQNVLKRKLWKNHAKLQVKENLSMELKAYRGLVDSNITILSMGRE